MKDESRKMPRRARARDWCATAFGVGALLALAEDVLSIEGAVWVAVRATVSAVFAVALVVWIVSAYRERQRGTARSGTVRSWVEPALMAAGVVALLLLLATVID